MTKRQRVRYGMLMFFLFTFPITLNYLSPYLIVVGATQGIITGSFIIFIVLFISSLVFGRAFCSYICPAGGFQDVVHKNMKKQAKRGFRDYWKYIIWVFWFSMILFFLFSAKEIISIEMTFMTDSGISMNRPETYIIYYGVIIIVLVANLILGKRGFCHSLCWMAPFMVIGRKIANILHIPRLQLTLENNDCINCNKCSSNCMMEIDVMRNVLENTLEDSECTLCAVCVDVCPKDVIGYKIKS